MTQVATRQMSAVREQHAVNPHRPKPASKPGDADTANAAQGKRNGSRRRESTSGGRDATSERGPKGSRGAERSGESKSSSGKHVALPGGKSIELPGSGKFGLPEMSELPIPRPHLSIWTRLAGKLLRRLAKHELRKLVKSTGKRLGNVTPDSLGKVEALVEKPREVLEKPREALESSHEAIDFSALKPSLPIQASVDIAVPLSFAWQRWMELSFLPEGIDRVVDIERNGSELSGRIEGDSASSWNAEILDERDCESFAWKSSGGSDCAGLVTFHSLSDRLTRLELTLDVLPQSAIDSASLLLHVADWRARQAMRRFKAELEVVSPDVYAADANSQSDNNQGR